MPSDAFKIQADLLYRFLVLNHSAQVQVMPDDHSDVVPLLPIPNRTVKRVSADDSADTRVKVGHRQAFIAAKARLIRDGLFVFQTLNMQPSRRSMAFLSINS